MRNVLLTGATGYIGGRLLEVLEARDDVSLRCLARRPEYLAPRVDETTEVVAGDLLAPGTLSDAMRGVDVAFYLVHSMAAKGSFEEQDRRAAENFATAARTAGVQRIVYLGGLGGDEDLSAHLESRQEVGRILRASGVPTIEFRAGIIIGSGSLSFSLIRALVQKLPVMVTPRWVRTPTQPISVEDVIAYLAAALDREVDGSVVYEIGGPDRVSYADLMKEYARQRGLKRLMIPVPYLSPGLSSLWLGLVTPVYARVGRALIEGVRNETVVRDDRALRDFPIRPRGVRAAIARALLNEDRRFAATRWSDAYSSLGAPVMRAGGDYGTRIVDEHVTWAPCPPAEAFRPIRQIGGRRGWYFANWAWRFRGLLDLFVGGAGMRRGRRDPEHVRPGDTLDFWRVEAAEEPKLLRLFAEMKVPGRAWLQFEVEEENGGSAIRQIAIFDPKGLFGLAYWYALYPIHQLIFRGMLRGIVKRAVNGAEGAGSSTQPDSGSPTPPRARTSSEGRTSWAAPRDR